MWKFIAIGAFFFMAQVTKCQEDSTDKFCQQKHRRSSIPKKTIVRPPPPVIREPRLRSISRPRSFRAVPSFHGPELSNHRRCSHSRIRRYTPPRVTPRRPSEPNHRGRSNSPHVRPPNPDIKVNPEPPKVPKIGPVPTPVIKKPQQTDTSVRNPDANHIDGGIPRPQAPRPLCQACGC